MLGERTSNWLSPQADGLMATGHCDPRGTGLLPASEHDIPRAAARVPLWPCCSPRACSQVRGGEGGVDVHCFGGHLQVQGRHQRLLIGGVHQLRFALLQEESVVRRDRDTPVLPRSWRLSGTWRRWDERRTSPPGDHSREEGTGSAVALPAGHQQLFPH